MTKLPRLYVKDKFSKIIHPVSLSITENIIPLSTASITLLQGEELPSRSYVELFTPYGSAGMYRVRSPHNTYGEDTSSAELEHMIAEVGDSVVKAAYSEMISATTAVSRVFSHYKGNRWKLGKYSDIGTGKIALETSYDSVLTALLGILEQRPECMMKFDFSTSPWTLSIVKRGTSVVAEGRLSRNVKTATVTYDDSELVTRVWYQTYTKTTDKDGKETITDKWVSRDADTLKTYGVVESSLSISSDMTDAEVSATVNAYINAHKHPRTSVRIQAEELNRITGERRDKFIIGDLYRLAMPTYSLTVELNVTSISWADVINTPEDVAVQLGQEEDTVVTFLHNMDATGSGTKGGSGGGGSRKQEEARWKEYFTDFEKTDNYIAMTATRVDRANNILEQAGMKLTSKGVLTYVKDNKNNLMSQIETKANSISTKVTNKAKKDLESNIKQTATSIRTEVKNKTDGLDTKITQLANKISLVVTKKDGKDVIDIASIVLGINDEADGGGSYIRLKAKTINLDGYVTADRLDAVEAFFSGQSTATSIVCLNLAVRSGTWTYGANTVSKKTATINGTTIQYLAWS